MRHDLPSVSFKIGCRKNCAMKFDCIYNDPETVVSFAAERCHACQYDWPNDPAKVTIMVPTTTTSSRRHFGV